jgi:hypothetical protein
MARWLALLSGQAQPNPQEASQLAMMRRIAGLPFEAMGNVVGAGARALGLPQPGPAITGALGSATSPLGSAMSNVGASGQRASTAAEGLSPYGPGSSFQETPYPTQLDAIQRSQGGFSGANPSPTAGMPNAGAGGGADPEAAYTRAYQQAQATQAAGPATPGAGVGMSATQEGDALKRAQAAGTGGVNDMAGINRNMETQRQNAQGLPGPNDPGFIGPKQNPEADYSLAYDKAAGGGGPGLDYQRGIGQRYEADPQSWVEDLFHSRGVDESRNPYAQSWSKSWSDAMPMLLDFYVMAKGGDPFSPEARTQALQTFGPDVISGKIHPSKVIEQALNTAKQSPEVMAALVQMGPEAVMGMRVLSSGQSPRVANAYNTVLRRRLADERRRQIANPGQEGNAEIPINIASGRG